MCAMVFTVRLCVESYGYSYFLVSSATLSLSLFDTVLRLNLKRLFEFSAEREKQGKTRLLEIVSVTETLFPPRSVEVFTLFLSSLTL